jgi:hypothetical protein
LGTAPPNENVAVFVVVSYDANVTATGASVATSRTTRSPSPRLPETSPLKRIVSRCGTAW